MQTANSSETDDRLRRQRTLEREIRQGRFARQEQIALRMKTLGFDVTQSSISRDLRELGVIKMDGFYFIPKLDRIGRKEPKRASLQSLIRSCEPAGPNLVVVKTDLGAASIVAGSIDELDLEGVCGTVAGDDTFFVATKNRAAQQRVLRALERV